MEDNAALLSALLRFVTQEAFRYMHEWEPGDCMLWDNLACLHCVMPWDYENERCGGRPSGLRIRRTTPGRSTECGTRRLPGARCREGSHNEILNVHGNLRPL